MFKAKVKAITATPISTSVSALVASLPRSPALEAAEADLSAARTERETLRSEIAMLSLENTRSWDAERERVIRDLHQRMRDAESQIKAARQRRNRERQPLASEVARTLAPIVSAEAEKLVEAVSDIRSAMETLGEAASVSQGFAVASLDEAGALHGYNAPELTGLPYLDQRPLAAIERFAKKLLGEAVL